MAMRRLVLGLLAISVFTGCRVSYDFLGPMVQIGRTDGKTGMVIVWRTDEVGDSRLDYGLFPQYTDSIYDSSLVTYHAVTLKDLRPGVRYSYRISTNGKVLAEKFFYTNKANLEPFTFAVFGDSGSGDDHQDKVARQLDKQAPDFILHTGDLIYYSGKDRKYSEQFYHPYRDLISRVPFFPSLGNHDYKSNEGQPMLDNFVLPGNERNYSFDYGNAHFIALDSNRANKESAVWLEADLAATQQKWKIVFFHHPPPFTGTHSGDENITDLWMPLFVKYKVDIVFCGHKHLYSRSRPVNGVVYIIEGVGGKRRYNFTPAPHWAYGDDDHWGFGWTAINGNELVFSHFTDEGKILDSFTIRK